MIWVVFSLMRRGFQLPFRTALTVEGDNPDFWEGS